jgi:hypothetical protein
MPIAFKAISFTSLDTLSKKYYQILDGFAPTVIRKLKHIVVKINKTVASAIPPPKLEILFNNPVVPVNHVLDICFGHCFVHGIILR